jgi:hypothetical protein
VQAIGCSNQGFGAAPKHKVLTWPENDDQASFVVERPVTGVRNVSFLSMPVWQVRVGDLPFRLEK